MSIPARLTALKDPVTASLPVQRRDHIFLVSRAAQTLMITGEKLWELQGYGWIWLEKNGTPCVPEHHVRKAQFILHLQQVLKLNPIQISRVLLAEKPPDPLHDYDIDRILAEAGVRVQHR